MLQYSIRGLLRYPTGTGEDDGAEEACDGETDAGRGGAEEDCRGAGKERGRGSQSQGENAVVGLILPPTSLFETRSDELRGYLNYVCAVPALSLNLLSIPFSQQAFPSMLFVFNCLCTLEHLPKPSGMV